MGDRQRISALALGDEQIAFGMFEMEADGTKLTTVALLATQTGPMLILNGPFGISNDRSATERRDNYGKLTQD